jgi:hypothetical protein
MSESDRPVVATRSRVVPARSRSLQTLLVMLPALATLPLIAEFPTLAEQDLTAFPAYALELVARNDGWDNVAVIDRGGAVVLNAALAFEPRPDLRIDLPHIRATVETGRPQVSDVYQSARTGERAIGVAVPVMRAARSCGR